MSSPERERTPIASPPRTITIPTRDGSSSPVRRRRPSDSYSDATDYPRLSPTLARTHNPHDPEHRERQRTLDVDMALHLSRARQNSESVGVAMSPSVTSPFHSLASAPAEHPSLLAHSTLQPFSEGEEREFEVAREGGISESAAPTVDVDHKSDFHFSRSEPTLHTELGGSLSGGILSPNAAGSSTNQLPHLSMGQDPDLVYTDRTMHNDASGVPGDDPEAYLPMYQPTAARESNVFDFSQLEEFVREEKRRLGLDTPGVVSPQQTLRWANTTTRPRSGKGQSKFCDASGEGSGENGADEQAGHQQEDTNGASSSSTMPRIRHRKLSQSQPTPRTGRGKKTALFEGAAGAPPPTLPALNALSGAMTNAMSSYDNIFGSAFGAAAPAPNGTPGGGQGHDRPYRFSFYSNALSATIHARSLSELPAEGQTFEELFTGTSRTPPSEGKSAVPSGQGSVVGTPNPPSLFNDAMPSATNITSRRVSTTAARLPGIGGPEAAPGYSAVPNGGMPRPGGQITAEADTNTWWLDVLNPTDEEMKMLSKVFSIHPLTMEDILMEETREKIELFRNYYLVCFRGFDQDPYSPTYLEPLNMYIIVFREGTLSFHFRATPHPQNVRRRIKQLKDYILVSSDWISYALIDDITDAFGPLIQSIEYEVDSIDELVLILKEAEQSDMLRRIGTCRKKVMGLLRLMGNKADVVKGLAKRCNENWRVAPTSDIGLYLSDIQDHLITMTQNLNHYEKILSRSHSNYLAQISIEMTEANNQINDVLSKMTALGTVLIPMNLVTGLWGMNVRVPGEGGSDLTWFMSILGGLIGFAVIGGYATFRLMAAR